MTTAPVIHQVVFQPHAGTVWLPTDPPRLCPDVLTGREAAVFLRLGDSRKAMRTLCYYRNSGKLKGVRVGKEVHYRLTELQRFVASQESATP